MEFTSQMFYNDTFTSDEQGISDLFADFFCKYLLELENSIIAGCDQIPKCVLKQYPSVVSNYKLATFVSYG